MVESPRFEITIVNFDKVIDYLRLVKWWRMEEDVRKSYMIDCMDRSCKEVLLGLNDVGSLTLRQIIDRLSEQFKEVNMKKEAKEQGRVEEAHTIRSMIMSISQEYNEDALAYWKRVSEAAIDVTWKAKTAIFIATCLKSLRKYTKLP